MKFQKGLYVKKNWSVRGYFIRNNPDVVIILEQLEGKGKGRQQVLNLE